VRRLAGHDSLLYLATMLRPVGLLLPLPDPSWLPGLLALGLNMAAEGAALKAPLARYSIPVATAFFMALPGALGIWGKWFGVEPEARMAADRRLSEEERSAAIRVSARLKDLWSANEGRAERELPAPGRAGAPAAAVVLIAAILALGLMRIDQQFHPAPRPDLADQRAILGAVPPEARVLAPDWAYAALANRAQFACIGSLEDRALDPAVLSQFDVVVLDLAPDSYELQRYPQLLPRLLETVRLTREYREARVVGGLHIFERGKPLPAGSPGTSSR
jgi:hypothetical protein